MLDSVSYLTSYGWKGKGNALKDGSISRPLAIPQKRTLSGLGKDRDEAFPFWDHIYTAASKSIKIKVIDDEDEDVDADAVELGDNQAESSIPIMRTSTGILSNRRPVLLTPATSGTTTPSEHGETPSTSTPRLGLLAMAKREAARKQLYASFFRGPILGPPTTETDKTVISGVVNTPPSLALESQLSIEPKRRKLKHCGELGNVCKTKRLKLDKHRHDTTLPSDNKNLESDQGHGEVQLSKGSASDANSHPSLDNAEQKRLRRLAKNEKRREREERQKQKEALRRAKEERRRTKEARRRARDDRKRPKDSAE